MSFFIDEMRHWRKSKKSILVSMMILFFLLNDKCMIDDLMYDFKNPIKTTHMCLIGDFILLISTNYLNEGEIQLSYFPSLSHVTVFKK